MMGDNVCFHREIRKIIFELSYIPAPPPPSTKCGALMLVFVALSVSSASGEKILCVNNLDRARAPD